jgi:hypothetical protein
MVDNYKVVCNTAAGRRRYMQYLIPFVIASDIVDRYDVWINTTDMQDVTFFKILAEKFPKINLVYQPDGFVRDDINALSIAAFYRQCTEEDTIYFRFDDDIVWMESDTIAKMVRFRIDNPEYFIVSPLIVNNAVCTYVLQVTNKIKLDRYYPAWAYGDIRHTGPFAAQLHEWFLTTQLPDKCYKNLHCGKRPFAMCRFSINAMLWFGQEMKKFEGIVPRDEEEFMSVTKAAELGVPNCINGDTIVAHFAFRPQRKLLDKFDVLNRYGAFLRTEWERDERMSQIHQTVQKAMREVENRKAEISSYPNVYTKQRVAKLRGKIAGWKLPIPRLYTLWKIRDMLIAMSSKQHIK